MRKERATSRPPFRPSRQLSGLGVDVLGYDGIDGAVVYHIVESAVDGVEQGDGPADMEYCRAKLAGLRVFEDDQGKMNLALRDVGGELLLVSQFTLLGDARHGRRPSFSDAAAPADAPDDTPMISGAARGF